MTTPKGILAGPTTFESLAALTEQWTRRREELQTRQKFAAAYLEVSTGTARVDNQQLLKRIDADLLAANRVIDVCGRMREFFIAWKALTEDEMRRAKVDGPAYNKAKLNLIRLGDVV